MSELDSACPTEGVDAANRIDPFWANLWASGVGGVSVAWASRSSFRRGEAAGAGRMRVSEKKWEPKEALDLLVTKPGRLAQLAATELWRTATGPQLTAITGRKGRSAISDLELLWAAELIQKGTIVNGMMPASSPLPQLYRLDPQAKSTDLGHRLTYAEWVGVTAGQDLTVGSQFDRHNLLTTELSLRVAEFCPIGSVFGEQLGGFPLLFGETRAVEQNSKRAADAVWVRPDGFRIAVEATASTSTKLREKVARWASALVADRTKSLMVIFVDVSPPGTQRDNGAVTKKILAEEANSTMDRNLARVAERMAFARWGDWFPALDMVDPAFIGLRAELPTGPPAARWRPVDLLDPYAVPFSPADPAAALAVLDNANLLYGVPHWLKTGPGPDLDAVVLARAGMPPATPMSPERRAHLAAIRPKGRSTSRMKVA
jgi:hypothetical protein